MKRKILWLGLSFLLVAALVLASCAKEVPGEQEEEEEEPVGEQEEEEEEEEPVGEQEEEEEPAVGGPQYGGSLTLFMQVAASDPATPDMKAGHHDPNHWLVAFQEKPMGGDFVKYGPRGTGEFAFLAGEFPPPSLMAGRLLESWEVTPERAIWHIRPGVMWHDNKPEIMEGREFTADDMVANLLYFRDAAPGTRFRGWTSAIYATDRYTVVIEFITFDFMWVYTVGWEDRARVSPPETIAAGAEDWGNYVGTGPWMNDEYVIGSHMKVVSNPDYWDTATIDGVEYQLPFIKEIILPIIPDVSTQIASLRTGKIDLHENILPMYWDTLREANPDLLYKVRPVTGGGLLALNMTEPPFDNINVRRAMTIGLDLHAFSLLAGVDIEASEWFPTAAMHPDLYIPLEELPAETQVLFSYDPALARRMLADEGYPDGFPITLYTGSDDVRRDRASLLKDQWALIGVDVEIKEYEETIISKYIYDKTYKGIADNIGHGAINPDEVMTRTMTTGGYHNFAMYSDPVMDQMLLTMAAEPDVDTRNVLAAEILSIYVNSAHNIPIVPGVGGHFYWPWIKNYYGEWNVDDGNIFPILAHAWIDQDLKADMGY